jgi:hypothetical protein
MKRLPIRGAPIASPFRSEAELNSVLRDLCVAHAFEEAAVHELYSKIGKVIGAWLLEQESMQVSPVAKALLSIGKNLTDAARLLSGHETGLRTPVEIEVTSQTAEFLALDPAVGSRAKARELIAAFQREAARIGHVCMVAYADLTHEAGKRGRPALNWHGDFTDLLLEVAVKAGVEPTLRKDRINPVSSDALTECRGVRKTPGAQPESPARR